MKYLVSGLYYDGDFMSQPAAIVTTHEIQNDHEAAEIARKYVEQLPEAEGEASFTSDYGMNGVHVFPDHGSARQFRSWSLAAKHADNQWTYVLIERLKDVTEMEL